MNDMATTTARPESSADSSPRQPEHASTFNSTFHLDYLDVMSMYRYRSLPYTVLSLVAAGFNLLSLVAILRIRKPRTVYHSLLANLAVGDVIGSVLVWLYHNSVLLYPNLDGGSGGDGDSGGGGGKSFKICLLKSAGLLVPILLAMTNSVLALLMLSINQYLAICRPLFAQTRLAPEKARMVIGGAWILSVCASFVPVAVVLIQAYLEDCSARIQSKMITSLEVCAYLLASLIMVVIFLYARIYREVLKCRKRSMELSMTSQKTLSPPSGRPTSPPSDDRDQIKLSTLQRTGQRSIRQTDQGACLTVRLQKQQQQPLLRPSTQGSARGFAVGLVPAVRPRNHSLGSPETNYKAFVTTLLMTGTLLLFWLPYLLVSSLTFVYADAEDYPDLLTDIKFYLIDFLPLVNYISDPIVYGVRIRCVRLSFERLFGSLCRRCRDGVGGQGGSCRSDSGGGRRKSARSGESKVTSLNPANGGYASGPATLDQDFSFGS